MTTVLGLFCLGVGASMLLWWGAVVARGSAPEWQERPRELTTHIGAELLSAGLMLAAGIGLLSEGWGAQVLAGTALGATAYAVVNASGFFWQRGERSMLAGFAVLWVLLAAALAVVLAH